MPTPRVLLVEDDRVLGAQVARDLTLQGYSVQWIQRGDDARVAGLRGIDLVVLDLSLPEVDGLVVLDAIRRRADVPILVLTGRTGKDGVVAALDAGADDYLTKPFWPGELVARVQARLRRPALARDATLRVGGVAIDAAARSVAVNGEPRTLTRVEFDLLLALARRPGAALTRTQLVDGVLDPEREGTERTLDVHISRLRKKLGAEGQRIRTVRGIGYKLRGEPA
jgi:two-component system response regulator MtrA